MLNSLLFVISWARVDKNQNLGNEFVQMELNFVKMSKFIGNENYRTDKFFN